MPLNSADRLMGKMRVTGEEATTEKKNLRGEVDSCGVCERAAKSKQDLWENTRWGEGTTLFKKKFL